MIADQGPNLPHSASRRSKYIVRCWSFAWITWLGILIFLLADPSKSKSGTRPTRYVFLDCLQPIRLTHEDPSRKRWLRPPLLQEGSREQDLILSSPQDGKEFLC